ncbi:MAG: serine hydrolase domain-containing protein [Pseudomonadota bacterium]
MTFMPLTNPSAVGLSKARLDRIPDFFQSYLDRKKMPCMATLVSRGGEVAHAEYRGVMDWDDPRPVGPDTIYRIYSMTKPITSVAAMMLFEEGALRLEHEVSRYIPAFKDAKVFDGGTADNPKLRAPDREIQIRDLFTHTSGVTYGFLFQHESDAIYRREKIGQPHETLEQMCDRIAGLPLAFSPGEKWNYGHSIDVLGRIVEVVSGQSLDDFFRDRIFGPLGMIDTDFFVPEDKLDRLMACYRRDPQSGEISLADGAGAASKLYTERPTLLNAGGGLASTMGDYYRFCLMLLRGGELDGVRILSPKTLEFMIQNHLPGGKTIKDMGDKTFSEARMEGNGFGLGWSTITDVVDSMQPGSVGTYSWGGLASTFFWIDPEEELIAIQMTQLMPSGAYPIRPQFQQLVYAAIEG